MDYTNYQQTKAKSSFGDVYDDGLRKYMLGIYNYMCAALGITGAVAFLAANTPAIMNLLYVTNANGAMTGMTGLGWLVAIAPLIMVLGLGFGISKMQANTAQALFWTYAVLMGLSLSSIFLMYTGASIARVFFITASVFGAMSIYGYTTKSDLTKMGSFLMMGLIGVILASLVNVFLKSSGIHFATSILSVLIFTGLTAYDTQRLKEMYYSNINSDASALTKLCVMGALTLYLDFINIFIQLMQFFGQRRD